MDSCDAAGNGLTDDNLQQWDSLPDNGRCQERSCPTGYGRTASSALDLLDRSPSAKLKFRVDHTKIMKPQPTQEKAE